MKKTLIALAALAATGATLAQSSVTIYGRLDLGLSQQETTVGAGPAGTVREEFSLAGAQDEWTGSRLGFRGAEDLGGGLRANFVYEVSINADRNTPAGASPTNNARTRLANLSLTGGFGTVTLGTFNNAFDVARGFGPDTGGVPGGAPTEFEAATVLERFDSRAENALAYTSPVFNGFTASVGLVSQSDETRTLAGAPAASQFSYNGFILGLGFTQGPLRAQLAYGNLDVDFHTARNIGSLAVPVNTDVTNWALGLSYNFGPVVVSFLYEESERNMVNAPGRFALAGVDRNAFEIGARFPMGSFAPYISFGQGERTDISTAGVRTKDDIDTFQIGATFNFSPRTWVYAAFGEATRERAGVNVRKETGYSVGIVHTF